MDGARGRQYKSIEPAAAHNLIGFHSVSVQLCDHVGHVPHPMEWPPVLQAIGEQLVMHGDDRLDIAFFHVEQNTGSCNVPKFVGDNVSEVRREIRLRNFVIAVMADDSERTFFELVHNLNDE